MIAKDVTVDHNTIVYNNNHGVSIGGNSTIHLDNNIIAFNQKLTIRAESQATVYQEFNNYFFNIEINEELPDNNISTDPHFVNSANNNFELQESSHCINNGSFGSDIGSQIFSTYSIY